MSTFADALSKEDRVDVKFTDFYKLMREAAKAELLKNAVNCDVPHKHIREMLTGEVEKNKVVLTIDGAELKNSVGKALNDALENEKRRGVRLCGPSGNGETPASEVAEESKN